jgi:hypothetical protein
MNREKLETILYELSKNNIPEECGGCLCGVSDCANRDGTSDCKNYNLMKPLYDLLNQKEELQNKIDKIKKYIKDNEKYITNMWLVEDIKELIK